MAELDGNYFLCDLTDQMVSVYLCCNCYVVLYLVLKDLAYELRDVEMDVEDKFLFTLAPVDVKKKKVVSALIKVSSHYQT